MSKKIFFRIAAICVVFNIAAAQSVSAYSIDLSIEKKEICIDNIPADRKVSLAISIYNNPATDQLGITITKDSALSFVGVVPISNVDPAFFNSYSSGMAPGNKDTAILNFWCSSGYYNGNNTLGYINLQLPENVSAGSFYPVDFINNNDLYIYYTNENGNRDYLLADSFNLTNGGIQINPAPQPATPAPVPTVPEPVQEPQIPVAVPAPDPNPVRQQHDNTPVQTKSPVADQTSAEKTSASLNTSASSVSSLSSEKNTSQKSSTFSSSKKSSDTTKVSDTEIQTSDSETTFVSKNKDKNTKNKFGPAPFIAAAVVLAAAAAVIIIKIKRKKA